ncbi:MAG: glycine-rich domain-containing protein-like [Betaproteobacteria bacterium]|nr:glycine-rich domain-containing protein-like [Betaproteobacteria bacterium]
MTTTLAVPKPISDERVAFLQSKGIDGDIARIDMEMVKMKMGEPTHKEGIGWNPEQLKEAEIEYKRYLMLCRKYPHPEHSIVPNKVMDTMWHYHILDTKAYVKDSEEVFGGYFHHYPYFGLRGDEDEQQLNLSFEQTKAHYENAFGESMVREGESKCVRDCVSRCIRECKQVS